MYNYKPGQSTTIKLTQGSNSAQSTPKTSPGSSSKLLMDVPWANMTISSSQSQINQFTIQWSKVTASPDNGNTSITYYQIEQADDTGTFAPLLNRSSSSSTYTLSVPTDVYQYGGTYTFRVVPINKCGYGKFYSNSLQVTTWTTTPIDAVTVTVTTLTGSFFQLDWTSIANNPNSTGGQPITSYQLWVTLTPVTGFSIWTSLQNTLTNTFTQTSGWTCNTNYTYSVRAINANGQGPSSTYVYALFPTVPNQMAAPTITEVTCSYVKLSWTALTTDQSGRTPTTYYLLQYKKGTASWNNILIASDLFSQTTYTHYYTNSSCSVSYGFTYYYQIAAGNECGAGSYSSTLTFQSPTVPVTMSAVTVAFADITPTNIKISWTALSTSDSGNCTITFYQLQYALVSGGSWSDLTTNPYTQTYYNWASGFNSNTQYQFKIKACNSIGCASSYSSTTAIITDTIPQAPNAPTAASINPTKINMTWTSLTGNAALGNDTITHYSLEYYQSSSNSWIVVNTDTSVLSNWAEYTLSSGIFSSGSTQIFRLRAKNGVGFGPYSSNGTCVADTEPTGMTAPVLDQVHPYNITVKWSQLGEPTNGRDIPIFYLLKWYNYETGVWDDLTSEAVDGLVYTYTHVRASLFSSSLQMQYRLLAKNGVGWGTSMSSILYVTTCVIPSGMTALSCAVSDINPTNITIHWPELTDTALNGKDVPYYYQVEWYNDVSSIWQVISAESEGHYLQYNHNHASVFTSNSNQQYRVTPKNQVGFGSAKSTITCVADQEPSKMNTPTLVSVNPMNVTISWSELTTNTETGRDTVIFYSVEWDQGTGNWVTLNQLSDGKVTTFTHTVAVVFQNNTNIYYRLRALNGVGYGPYSNTLTVLTDDYPLNMPAPTLYSVSPYEIAINWTDITADANTGRDAIVYYEVRFRPDTSSAWVALTTSAVGKQLSYVHTVTTMFTPDTNVYYKICPENGVGMDRCSSELTVLTDTIPQLMNAPVTTDAHIHPTWIYLTWTGISSNADTGRDPIIFYDLQWDEGTTKTTWTSLIPDSDGLLTAFNHTSVTIFPNDTKIYYRLRAKNTVGYGPTSTEYEVLTDRTPQFMNPPVITDADIMPTHIKITLTPISDPTQNGRDDIIYYGIEWDQGFGTYVNITDEATQGTLTTFTHTPITPYDPNTDYYYRAYAKNGVGYGEYSTEIKITSDNVPTFMNAPTNTSIDYNAIGLSWVAITDDANTGRDPVIYYRVEYYERPCYLTDAGDCSTEDITLGSWKELSVEATQGILTTFTHDTNTHFHSNSDYQYRICAKNGVGLGACSDNITVTTDSIPMQMDSPLNVTIIYNMIEVKWPVVTADDKSGRSPVTQYRVQWDNYLFSDPSFTSTSWVTLGDINQDTSATYLSYQHILNPHFDGYKHVHYRVAAINNVGVGIYSDSLDLITDDVPLAMTSPTIADADIIHNQITIKWSAQAASDIGGDDIQYYKLEWDEGDSTKGDADNTWTELTSISNGLLYEYTQTSTGAHFPNNTVFRYRLTSKNGVGYGPCSTPTSITTDRTPLQMAIPTNSTVTALTIVINWVDLVGDANFGRDPLIHHKLEYNGGSAWETLTIVDITPPFTYTHTLAAPFPANTDRSPYNVHYRVTAENGVGYGIPSDDLLVTTDTYPKKMNQVTITGDITPYELTISWTRLVNGDADQDGGDPVINYQLEWLDTTDPMNTNWVILTTAPETDSSFTVTNSSFTINTVYHIRIAGINGVGLGPYSDYLEITTDNVPTRMNAPVENTLNTNANQITIDWANITDPVDTGRDDVVYYKLEWDQGASVNTWVELTTPDTIVNTFTQTTAVDGIQNGTAYSYKITPKNRAGFGASSSITIVIPSSPPDKMDQANVTLNNAWTYALITWLLPIDNGAAVNSYHIQILGFDGNYYDDLTNCDGSSPTIVSSRSCQIPMTTLRASPFNLVRGSYISAIAKAANIKGYNSSFSTKNNDTNSNKVETESDAPSGLARQASGSDSTKFTAYWSSLSSGSTGAGGKYCSIQSYHLQRNQGNSTGVDVWTDLKGYPSNDSAASFTATVGIIGGTTYKVRVRALNKYGWGNWSSIVSMRAAKPPDPPTTITITNNTIYFTFAWNAPVNNGLDVTSYTVLFYKRTISNYAELKTECDGTNAAIIAGRTCNVLMSTLRTTSSWNQQYGNQISVKIYAQNAEGNSSSGTYLNNSGPVMQDVPILPPIPIACDLANTNDLQMKISWSALTDINSWRGYEVHAYEIWWQDKDGIQIPSYELLYTDTKPFLLTLTYTYLGGDINILTHPIVGGTRYKFKYRALNIHGSGAYSAESMYYASTIPDQLAPPSTSLYNQTVTISWTVTPNDHKQTVTAYRVKFKNKAGSWVEDLTICKGSSTTAVASQYCTANMLLFTTNMGLAIDDLIEAKVEAMNVMGYSIPSDSNTDGVTAKKLPQTAPSALNRGANTGKTVVQINWTGLTANVDTGGQPVDYRIQYDKASNGANWYTLTDSTTNLTTYTDVTSFTVGKAYQFKVAGWNDFGTGPYSSAFTIYTAIAPSGLADPTTTLNLLTYIDDDDMILIDWNPPTDDGGLTVSYKIEVKQSNGVWTELDYPNECAEKGTITNYFLPQATTANAATQCTMLVSKLKSKYGLAVGDTVLSRITSYHVVGSTTTTMTGAGTATIPTPSCFRTTFPRVIGGTNQATSIMAMDVDTLGNIVVGGSSQDSGLLGKSTSQTLPMAMYIAKGNFYVWGKYIETTDGVTANLFTQVLDITFRYDGQKIAMALDRSGYGQAYTIVILNKDGSLYGAFKESTNIKGKVNITGLLYDSSNYIMAAIDTSQDGSDMKKNATIARFSVANPTAASTSAGFYLTGGATNKISQAFCLQRIKSDTTAIYASVLIQDSSQNRKALLAKVTLSNGAITKYFQYTTTPLFADYNSDTSIAVIKRMSLYEDDLTTLHIISACLVSQDGFKPHFGQFIFSTTQVFTVMVPQNKNRWYCLGTYQRVQNIAYVLYNDRSADTSSGYGLYYGRIDYTNKKIDSIPILNHDGDSSYYGALFVHLGKFYYWGDGNKLITSSTYNYAQRIGFLNLFDQLDPNLCVSSSQSYSFSGGSVVTVNMDPAVTANMNWVTSGLATGPVIVATTGKSFKPLTLSSGVFNLNLKEPMVNNTWCPIVSNPAPATMSPPTIPATTLNYDPDASSYPPQDVSYSPFTLSGTCPDQVFYYTTFLSDTSQPLLSFITFDPSNSKYSFAINNPSHVGMYYIMLQSTVGNNITTSVAFTVQVASPCLVLQNTGVIVPTLASTPTYDISDLVPLYIDLDWQVISPPTPSCGPIHFIFTLLNSTAGGVVDTSIFSIVNQSSGVQQIKVWTQSIPAAKLWTDIKIEGRLQGDLVKTYIYTILITNKCAVTTIIPVPIADQVYYTGRDAIDFQFIWSETVGTCGPISYFAKEFDSLNMASNNSLDTGVFAYPKPSGGNDTLRIYTWDDGKVGTYYVRVWSSLGVGGFQQTYTTFSVQIIKDPCSYFPYVTSFVPDLTLWINQTNQVAAIPPFTMNDTNWVCNFSYEIRSNLGAALDPIFVVQEVANEGQGTNITLVTTDKTKVELSPQGIRVRGWPKRQNTSSQQFTFRIFVAYLDLTDCPSGSFYNSATESCQDCVAPCSTCKSLAQCTWCIAGYTFISSTSSCVLTISMTDCPGGTYKDVTLNMCRQCSEFCQSCTDYNTCTACVPRYSLANGKCYQNRVCPEGYRFDDNLGCVSCPSGCASCPSTTKCSYCKDGYYLDTSTSLCAATCPKGYFADLNSRVCMVCGPTCAACVNNNYTCTECQDVGGVSYYLFGSTCVQRCPYIGYYQNDVPPRKCQPCNPQCKICINAVDDCIVCNTGSVISGRQCLNSCPDGYYITVIGTCFKCDSTCSKCYGSQNSMCTQCVEGQFLTTTTCDSKCAPPLFPNPATRTCQPCQYYCNQCTTVSNCMKCKTGFIQLPNDCSGEQFLRVSSSQAVSMPLNTAVVTDDFNPSSAAIELWFKADNILSMNLEIILGVSPYKFRKKAGVAQVQFNWLDLNYCDSTNLKSDQWYHFGLSMTEDNSGSLSCFLDGEPLNIGQAPVAAITADIAKFKEITFGSSIDIKTSESKFNGYVKEFRWWKKPRSKFQFANFKNVALTDITDFSPPNQLLAYWKLDEKKTDTKFTDFASGGTVQFDPSTIGKAVTDLMEMREIYLKMCPEGTFVYFNDTAGYFNCTQCDPACKNCNGDSPVNCTSCVAPFKLLETEQKCIINAECPKGYFADANKNCWPCHEYCTDCYGSDQFMCTACKTGFFKAYKRTGCVDSCPRGLYGNYLTQSCSANPVITSLYPEDGLVIAYGTFIDLIASYQVLNQEPLSTYWYGWIITKQNSNVDIAKDAAKRYAGEDILRVHLDNNIIEPNSYYNITFYVKGNDSYYNGMLGSMFNVIYIGIPPKGGACFTTPPQGIATVTEFTFTTGNWIDPDGISEFHFSYSFDNGATYLPIEQSSYVQSQLKYTFQAIFQTVIVKLRCQVKSIKGFYASKETQFLLTKRSTANSKVELTKLSLNNITTEMQSLTVANQIKQIASDIGSLKKPVADLFDPKVSAEACTEELCSFNGECQYNTFTKKYFCKCYGIRAGVNCTFKNSTELELARNLTLQNAKTYIEKSQGTYDTQFLKTVTSQVDLMSDDLFDKVHDLVISKVIHLSDDMTSSDITEHQESLEILSQMLEYIDNSHRVANLTWNMTDITPDKQEKLDRMWDNVNRTMRIVDMIKNSTLYKLSFLQTQIQLTSRMISIKQVLSSKDKILSMPATDNIKKQFSTFIKLSPANFLDADIELNNDFIAEAIEYSINPFQMGNNDRIATNIFEMNLYNQNLTVTTNEITKVSISNLSIPFEISFPANDNQNLTQFLTDYNALSPYRYSERKKKEEMIVKSGLSCVYWDKEIGAWSKKGCQLSSLDNTHIKCVCNHLTAFATSFTTPKLSIDAPLLENSTTKADTAQQRTLTLQDIIKWPLDAYFSNMYELWQHSRPSFLSFIIKPGFIVLALFWAMYLSSLIYYSGRDDLKRDKMTKAQNREDLAELKDDTVQNLGKVIRDLIVSDFLHDHGKYIARESRRLKVPQLHKKQVQPPQVKIYEQLTKDEQKKYKQRARRKVFGVPAGMCDRALRFYKKTMKQVKSNPNAKMNFFSEEIKNNLWIGLIAKTSKIAPRHVRLALMYFYTSLHIIALTIVFGFQLQEYISDVALFQVVVLAILVQMGVWVITIPVAFIFRMPLHLRKMIEGVRSKKVNKAFKEVDKHMGWRYATGYFICLTSYAIMSVMVIVFNLFYPHDYVMGWAFNIILLYIFDLVVFTFLLASIQFANVIISGKVKCWYHVWAAIEVFRYAKNLRG